MVDTDVGRSPGRMAEDVGSEITCSGCLRERYVGRKYSVKDRSQSAYYHRMAHHGQLHQSKLEYAAILRRSQTAHLPSTVCPRPSRSTLDLSLSSIFCLLNAWRTSWSEESCLNPKTISFPSRCENMSRGRSGCGGQESLGACPRRRGCALRTEHSL